MVLGWPPLGCRSREGPVSTSRTGGASTGQSQSPINPRHLRAYVADSGPDGGIGIAAIGPRQWKVVDIHEHLRGEREAERLLVAMDQLGIQRTCLMGSTEYTLTLNAAVGFEGFKENNDAILGVKGRFPERFCAFVTLDPLEAGNLQRLKDYVARGADGLKLYLGHGGHTGSGPFHSMPLDDPRMEPIFAWAEAIQLPIVLHVNLEKFWDEAIRLLEKHPYLRVDLPHFGLEKGDLVRLRRLSFLLDRYPYVYTDISAGYFTIQIDAFEVIAMDRSTMRPFIEAHRAKIMYGADMVLESHKDDRYILNTLRSYMQLLESPRWRFFLSPSREMYGLEIDEAALRGVYEGAAKGFLLLDGDGRLPDRTKGWPIAGVPIPARPALRALTSADVPAGPGVWR